MIGKDILRTIAEALLNAVPFFGWDGVLLGVPLLGVLLWGLLLRVHICRVSTSLFVEAENA